MEIKNYIPKDGFGLIYMYTFDDGKRYIGQTNGPLIRRHKQHLCEKLVVDNMIRKHGYTLEVLDEVPINELNHSEQYYISEFSTMHPNGWNFTSGGNNGRVWSEEVLKRLSETHKGSNGIWYGKHRSEETRRKISESLKGKKHPMYGARGKNTYHHKPVVQIDLATGQEIARFDCARDVERILGISHKHIGDVCRGRRRHSGGYGWRYAHDHI